MFNSGPSAGEAGKAKPQQFVPPGPRKAHAPLKACSFSQQLKGIVLSARVFVVHTHWTGTRTVECRGDHVNCPFRVDRYHPNPTQKGYLAALSMAEREVQLFELTEGAMLYNPEAMQAEDLRGTLVTVQRIPGGFSGKVRFSVEPYRKMALPPCPDVAAILWTTWSGKCRVRGQE